MKKVILVLFGMILLMSSAFTYADKFAENEVVELLDSSDQSTSNYTVVNLMLDGDDVLADVPAIIYELNNNSRTLVPISFIAQKIGAEINWDGANQEVTIDYNGKNIVLKIDSAQALVDGKQYELPNGVPAKLMAYKGTYRTMVPVNFITQQLGYEIYWLGDTRTVSINKPKQTLTGIRYSNDGTYPELRFKVSGEVSMTSFSINGALIGEEDQLVLDFHNTKLDLAIPPKYGKFVINDMFEEIFDVVLTQTSTNPYSTKAVIGLGYYRNGDISYDKRTGEMVVQLINSVNYVEVEELNGVQTIVIDTTENPAYNVFSENGKFYVDIIHSKLKNDDGSTNQIDVNSGGIKLINYLQVDNSSEYDLGTKFTRVEVELEKNTNLSSVYVEDIGSKVYVFVSGVPQSGYSYARDMLLGTSSLSLDLNESNEYPVIYDGYDNSLMITIPKSDITLDAFSKKYDDGVINAVAISSDSSNENYNIKIYLEEGTKYTKKNDSISSLLNLQFVNESLMDSKYSDKIIVIDAGHGGHDPGATSPNGVQEKGIALEASLMLKKKLENKGFKVYMTRDRDNYVKLYDRAAIANQLSADLFISVHINAAGSTSAKGIETLYAPDSSRNNKELARAIQDGMIAATNNTNRGIVSRPELVVIRETEMDAVLVELGFLSNRQDEIRLLTESYLDKCVEGILQGVVDFMD